FLLKKESNTYEMDEKNSYGLEEKDYQETWIAQEEDTAKKELIKKLYSELNKNQQEAIYHRYVEGLSCEEIADLMHINYQSAKNLIHRAIKKMKSVAAFTSMLCIIINTLTLFAQKL
ncbi:MAG: RNA polymerase sigma factor, partial [Paludibacter sp.]